MTEDEKRRQQADLLLEFQDTEHEIAHLQEKAKRIGELIAQFGEWMKHSPTTHVFRGDQAHHGYSVIPSDQRIVAALNADEAFTLADELRSASARLRDLEERKRKLGLR